MKTARIEPDTGMSAKSRTDRFREEILREWRGGDEATNLDSGVHLANRFVAAILKAAGATDGLDEDEVKAAWREVAGDFIAANSQPVSVKAGHLVLRVTQPAMRFHLEQMKPMLLDRIRARFGAERIHSVRFTLG